MKKPELEHCLYDCDPRVEFTPEEISTLQEIDSNILEMDRLISRNYQSILEAKKTDKVLSKMINQSTKEIHGQRTNYCSVASNIQMSAEDRFIRTSLNGDPELILFDVKEKTKSLISKGVKYLFPLRHYSELLEIGNRQQLFKAYVFKVSYHAARMHMNYCSKHKLTECRKAINDNIMKETRNRFKLEMNFDPECDFSIIRYGQIFSELRKPNEALLDINKKDDEIVTYEFSGMTVEFNKYKKLSVPGLKLLDFLLLKTNNNEAYKSGIFSIPFEHYMNICELSASRNAKQQVLSGLSNLFSVSVTLKEHDKKSKITIGKSRLISSYQIRNGYIIVEATQLFTHIIKRSIYTTLPNLLFRINSAKNPHSYYFLKKISELKNINQNSTNEDIVTIRTLLESCPTLPKYEDIKKNGQINQRIKDPFFRDMDALNETLNYELYDTKRDKISIDDTKGMSYEDFENIRVHIAWKAYPDRKKTKTELN